MGKRLNKHATYAAYRQEVLYLRDQALGRRHVSNKTQSARDQLQAVLVCMGHTPQWDTLTGWFHCERCGQNAWCVFDQPVFIGSAMQGCQREG